MDLLYFDKFYNEDKTKFKITEKFLERLPYNLFEKNRTLKKIDFGHEYNYIIDDIIFPDTIEILKFGYDFRRSLDKVILPPNLHTIIFSGPQIEPLNNLPNTIKRLEFFKINIPLDNLPISLEEIIINDVKSCALFSASKIVKLPFGCKVYWLYRNYHYKKELCIDKLEEIFI